SSKLAARKKDSPTAAQDRCARARRRRSRRGQRSASVVAYRWPTLAQRVYRPLRRAAELALSLTLLAVAAPVIGLAALAVKLTSPAPAFYTQLRVGRFGRPFTIFKIRTMIHNCESLTGPRWAIPGDPRVTAVGQFLRITHIDELPQLLNVLRGDMS